MANPIFNTTSVSSLKGYLQYASSLLLADGSIPLVKTLGGGAAEIYSLKSKSKVNKAAANALNSLAADPKLTVGSYKAALKNINIEISDRISWTPTAANIMKSGDKVPKGYFAETILQAAVTARFVDARAGSAKVTPAMVIKHLTQFLTTASKASALSAVRSFAASSSKSKAIIKAFEFDVENQNKKIGKDKVYVLYTLNEAAFKWMQARVKVLGSDPEIKPFIMDSVSYVNSGAAVEHSDYFYTNGRVDRIDILSLGISGQGKTKADIRTMYYEGWTGGNTGTPHKMTLNLSVKINHVEQVGQISGITSDKLSQLADVIGSSLSDATKKKIDAIVNQGVNPTSKELKAGKQGQKEIYQLAYSDMKKNVSTVPKLFRGIEHFVSLTEASTLDIVDIGSGLKVYFVRNLKALEKSCKNDAVKAEINISPGGNYSMTIYAGSKELLQYSSRFTGGVYRNFVSTGEALRQILSRI